MQHKSGDIEDIAAALTSALGNDWDIAAMQELGKNDDTKIMETRDGHAAYIAPSSTRCYSTGFLTHQRLTKGLKRCTTGERWCELEAIIDVGAGATKRRHRISFANLHAPSNIGHVHEQLDALLAELDGRRKGRRWIRVLMGDVNAQLLDATTATSTRTVPSYVATATEIAATTTTTTTSGAPAQPDARRRDNDPSTAPPRDPPTYGPDNEPRPARAPTKTDEVKDFARMLQNHIDGSELRPSGNTKAERGRQRRRIRRRARPDTYDDAQRRRRIGEDTKATPAPQLSRRRAQANTATQGQAAPSEHTDDDEAGRRRRRSVRQGQATPTEHSDDDAEARRRRRRRAK